MSIVKIIELSGSSPIGWEDAAKNAVRAASVTVKDMVCVDVMGWPGRRDLRVPRQHQDRV